VCEKKRFAQKFRDMTDGQTDIRTDDGRLAIALAHSWNELINAQTCVKRMPCLTCWATLKVTCDFEQSKEYSVPGYYFVDCPTAEATLASGLHFQFPADAVTTC